MSHGCCQLADRGETGQAGRCEVDAAGQVGGPPIGGEEVVDLVLELVTKSLVAADGYYFVYRKEDETRADIVALREWILQTFATGA